MTSDHARLSTKTWMCATVVVTSNVAGNFFMKRGLPAKLSGPADYITVLFQPWVTLGVVLLVLWMLSRMALLSWADLSYVLPVTSVGYVLVALAGRLLLNEQISMQRWAGILLIMAGVALVSGGAPRSSAAGHHDKLPRIDRSVEPASPEEGLPETVATP